MLNKQTYKNKQTKHKQNQTQNEFILFTLSGARVNKNN